MHARRVITIATAAVWVAAPAAQAAPLPADAGSSVATTHGGGLTAVADGASSADISGIRETGSSTKAPVDGDRSSSPWSDVVLVLAAAFAITLATVGSIRLTRLTKPPQPWRPSTG